MPRIKVEEGRKLTEIKFDTDHYLANLLACTKILGIPLSKASRYEYQSRSTTTYYQ